MPTGDPYCPDHGQLPCRCAELVTVRGQRDAAVAFINTIAPHADVMFRYSEIMMKLYEAVEDKEKTKNFVTLDMTVHRDEEKWTITAQRADGKTPTERIGELSGEVEHLRDALLSIVTEYDADRQHGWEEKAHNMMARAAEAIGHGL